MSLPAPRDPSHDGGKWETILYALDSNARTLRLCLIWAVVIVSPLLVTVVTLLLRHVLLSTFWSDAGSLLLRMPVLKDPATGGQLRQLPPSRSQ
jgi:hypothetical protein